MAQFSMITEAGLQQITAAKPSGSYIEIAYWVPVYDYRIDPQLGVSGSAYDHNDITTVTTSGDTFPSGDIFWNTSGSGYYTIEDTTTNKYLVSAIDTVVTPDGSDDVVTNFLHRDTASPVMFNDGTSKYAIGSSYLWGSDVQTPGSQGTEWRFVGGVNELEMYMSNGLGFPDQIDHPDQANLYRGVSYISEINGDCSASYECRRANFEITLAIDEGSIKFNKIGLYGVVRDAVGLITTEPFLFGQVIIPEAQTIVAPSTASNNNSAVTSLVLDYQIAFSSVDTNFNEVFYGTSADYWHRATNASGQYGLATAGSVFITNTLGVEDRNTIVTSNPDDIGVSKLFVATYDVVNKPNPIEEQDLPQLCLQHVSYPADLNNTFDTGSNQVAYRIRTTMRTNQLGHCEIDMYGACNTDGYYSFMPLYDNTLSLGKPSNRWRSLYLGTSTEYNFGDYDLYDGPDRNPDLDSVNSGTRWNYIEDRYNTGYIVIRENDLVDESYGLAHFGNTSIYVGPHYDDRDIVPIQTPGGFEFKQVYPKSNNFYTYSNISNYIPIVIDPSTGENLSVMHPLTVRSSADIFMFTLAGNQLSIDEFGSGFGTNNDSAKDVSDSIIRMIANGDRGNEIDDAVFIRNAIVGKEVDGVLHPTIFKKFFSVSDDDIVESITSLDELRLTMYGEIDLGLWGDDKYSRVGKGVGRDINLISSRFIHTNGDILPVIDGFNNLGSSGKGFRDLHVRRIMGDWQEGQYADIPRHLMLHGDVYPDLNQSVIGRNKTTNFRWAEMNADSIGNDKDWCDRGYITNFNTHRLDMREDSKGSKGHLQFHGQGHIGFGDNGTYINNNTVSTENIMAYHGEFETIHVGRISIDSVYDLYKSEEAPKFTWTGVSGSSTEKRKYRYSFSDADGWVTDLELSRPILPDGKWTVSFNVTSDSSFQSNGSQLCSSGNKGVRTNYDYLRVNKDVIMNAIGFTTGSYQLTGAKGPNSFYIDKKRPACNEEYVSRFCYVEVGDATINISAKDTDWYSVPDNFLIRPNNNRIYLEFTNPSQFIPDIFYKDDSCS